MFGFLNINKPKGMTSHDVIACIRRILKIKQVGHSGTLDPMATGVLPIAIGKATRLIEYLSDEKAYVAKMKFGVISDSYDSDGNIEKFSDKLMQQAELEAIIPKFIGEIKQKPPIYSAVHHNGKRLYELAREGKIVDEIPERLVKINNLQLVSFDFNGQTAEIMVSCEKGTYIRSIIHDMGQLLTCGAIMTDLVRSCSSVFQLEDAIEINQNTTFENLKNKLINPLEVLLYNQKILTFDEFNKVKHGNFIENDGIEDDKKVLLTYNSELIAVGEVNGSTIKTCKVLI